MGTRQAVPIPAAAPCFHWQMRVKLRQTQRTIIRKQWCRALTAAALSSTKPDVLRVPVAVFQNVISLQVGGEDILTLGNHLEGF